MDTKSEQIANNMFEGKKKTSILGLSKETYDMLVKAVIWILLTIWIAFSPIVMSYSYTVNGHKDKLKYVGPTCHFICFASSILLGTQISYVAYGVKGVKDCFRWRNILILAPVSMGYAFSELLALKALSTVSPIWYAIIHKTRLFLTFSMTATLLRRKIPLIQWIQCLVVTCFVMAFCFVKLLLDSHANNTKNNVFGIILLLCNISMSSLCAIGGEWGYKKLGVPLPVQIVAGRITATIASLIFSVGLITYEGWWKYGFFGGPGGGWDFKVVLLVAWNVCRDWLTCANLLYLSAIWKALAAVVAMIITYFFDVLMSGAKVNAALITIVIGIFLSLLNYTLGLRDESYNKKVRQRNEELEKQLNLYEEQSEVTK